MPDYMEHERMRWSYMTLEQLERRLPRITKPEKLEAFITMALLGNHGHLAGLARGRAEELGVAWILDNVRHLSEDRGVPGLQRHRREVAREVTSTVDLGVMGRQQIAREIYQTAVPGTWPDSDQKIKEREKPKVRMIRIGKRR